MVKITGWFFNLSTFTLSTNFLIFNLLFNLRESKFVSNPQSFISLYHIFLASNALFTPKYLYNFVSLTCFSLKFNGFLTFEICWLIKKTFLIKELLHDHEEYQEFLLSHRIMNEVLLCVILIAFPDRFAPIVIFSLEIFRFLTVASTILFLINFIPSVAYIRLFLVDDIDQKDSIHCDNASKPEHAATYLGSENVSSGSTKDNVGLKFG